jgi:hypothetical protein
MSSPFTEYQAKYSSKCRFNQILEFVFAWITIFIISVPAYNKTYPAIRRLLDRFVKKD